MTYRFSETTSSRLANSRDDRSLAAGLWNCRPLLLLALASCAFLTAASAQTIQRLQTASNSGAFVSTLKAALPNPTGSGHTLVVAVSDSYASDGAAFTVSDTYNNTWHTAVQYQDGAQVIVFFAENITGGAAHSITVSSSLSAYYIVTAVEYSGLATHNSLDIFATNRDIVSSYSSGAVYAFQSNELLFGVHHVWSTSTSFSPSAPWSTIATVVASDHMDTVQDRTTTSTGIYASTGLEAPASDTVSVMVGFKGAVDPAVPSVVSFNATPQYVVSGGQTTLSWRVADASSVSIDHGVGTVTGLTSITISPSATGTYTLTASNSNGTATAQTTITIVSPLTNLPVTWSEQPIIAPNPPYTGFLNIYYDNLSHTMPFWGAEFNSTSIWASTMWYYNPSDGTWVKGPSTGAMTDQCSVDQPNLPGERHPLSQLAVDSKRNRFWQIGRLNEACNGSTVSTSGQIVTLTDQGAPFVTTNTSWSGAPAVINGGNYTIDHVIDSTHLMLTSSAGSLTGVHFQLTLTPDMYYVDLNTDVTKNQWHQIFPQHQPATFWGALVYAPDVDVLFLFGTDGAAQQNDSWVYCPTDLNPTPGVLTPAQVIAGCYQNGPDDWSQVGVDGIVPPGVIAPGLIYDPNTHQVIQYGGQSGTSVPQNQTWAYNLLTGVWTQKCLNNCTPPPPAVPPPGVPGAQDPQVGFAYHPTRHTVLYHQSAGTNAPADWEYDPVADRWTRLQSNGGGPYIVTSPMLYDTVNNQVVTWSYNQGYPDIWFGQLAAPPVISNIQASGVSSSSATITWTTDVTADSQVEYGTSTTYGLSSALNSSAVTAHSVTLSGLAASMVYHYRVKSRDSAGLLAVSSDNTFTTAAGSGGPIPVRIQSKGAVGNYASFVPVTFTNSTTTGNELIVAVTDYYPGEGVPFSISDNKGNTWKTAVDYANGAHIIVFYAENIVGGAGHTVTVSASGQTYFNVTGVEYTGLAASNSLDTAAANRGTGASYTSGAATTASGNELLFGVHHVWGNGISFTPSAGWNTVGLQVSGDEAQVQDQVAAAVGSYASTGTESSSNDTVSVLVAFKSGSPSAAPTISSFTASPAAIVTGQSSTLSWNTAGATSVTIDSGVGSVAVSGSISVSPAATTSYTLTATNANGTVTAQTTITVSAPNPPVISNIQASGVTTSSANISWTTDVTSDSQVDYGITTAYNLSSSLNSTGVTTHSVALSGLAASTIYHYRVKSRNSLGLLTVSGDNTFTTAAGSGSVTTPVRVQSKGGVGNYSSSVAVTFPNATTTGNELIVAVTDYYPSEGVPFAISDSKGNTWKTAIDYVNSAHIIVFYAENIAGAAGHTVTVTASGSTYFSVTGIEYAGLAASNSLDVTASVNRGTGASYTSGAATIGSPNELLLGVHHVWGGGISFTPSAGWSTVGLQVSGDEAQVQDQVVSAAGSYASTGTESSSNDTVSLLVAFKPGVSSTCVAINAIQGVAITPVTMTGSGGTGSGYTFSASGLPAGLTMAANGIISGIPTVTGTFSYTVSVTDSAGNTGTVSCSVTVVVPVTSSCVAITAVQGVAITPVTMTGSGGTGSGYTFSASGLPAGLTMAANGTISGIPTVSGTFNYTVTVKDSAGNTGTVNCSVTVVAPVSAVCVAINAIQGVAITPVTMTGSGGAGGPYTFSASGLPAGLTMSANGTISGTPTASGTFNYSVTVTDSAGNTGTVNCSVTVAAPVSAACVAITAVQGVAITPVTMAGSGGTGSGYTFSASGLPAGLTMAANGSISGTPTVSGTFSYTVTVKDSAGNTGTVTCSVTVAAPVSAACVAINAIQGVAITPATMTGTGGTGTGYTFSASGLPAGLTMAANGTISGTPSVSGTFNYTVTVKDSAGNTASVNCSITVAAPVSAACVAISAIQGVAITPVTMTGSGGAGGPYTFSASGLPAGLTMAANGTISGTPTASGTFNYSVTVTDSTGNTASVNCSVTVAPGVSAACVAINAIQGVAITPVTMAGSGGTGSGYTFSASGLPTGLTMAANGTISGTPSVSGTFSYTVTVKDSAGNTGTVTCSITVAPGVSAACVAINAIQGVAITPATMTGTGGTGTGYTFSASGLPAGLTMAANGTISGTPSVSGTFSYTVTVKDSAGNTGTVTCSVTVAPGVSAACVVINAIQGVAITPVTMTGSGGTGSGYSFSSSNLPAGLTISSGGTISGTPTVAGTFSYTVTVQDSAGNTGTVNCSVTVAAGPVISNIQASAVTSSSANISWTTDVTSDSQVDYGTTSAYGLSSSLNSTAVTAHNVALSGLAASTVYHYRVKSRNGQGLLTVSADNTFTTVAGNVGATPVRVQSKGGVGNYARSVTVTFPNATTTGNELIVAVTDYYPSEGVPFAISDSKGNTWKTAIDYVNSAHIIVFYAENIVGGAGHTVTVTASGSTYYSVTGMEYAGLAASNSLDVTAVNRGTGASYTSGAATIASPNELLLGVHHVWGGGTSFTPSAGWSTVGLQVSGDEAQVQDQVVAAPGSYASTGTESSSNDTVSVLVAFKPGASVAAPTISSFTASPAAIVIGQSSTLSWNTVGATSVTIDSGVGPVAVSGSTSVTPAATTTYTLTAVNAYGTVTAQSTITVSAANPPVVSNIQATGVTASSASISWMTDVTADSQVDYGTTSAYNLSSPLNSSAVTAHSVAMSGLAASTVYHYRVKSRNGLGLLTVSGDNTFTTLTGSVASTPVRVQSKGGVGNYSKSVAVTLPNATTSGNELIVAVTDYYPSEGVPFAISDSKGNTWKTAIDYVNSAHIIVFYAENIVGGAGHTVTVTASGPTYYSVTGMEYAGLAASNSLDVTAVNRGTGASYTSGAATIASPNELLLGVHHVWGGGISFTPSAGWSTVGLQVSGDEAQVQDRVVAAAGSYASTGTESSSSDTVSVLVAFKPGASVAVVSATCVAINAIQGVAITPVALTASGGSGSGYTFSASGLPAGLTISAGGTISGTPTVSGTFNYTVTVQDSAGNTGTVNCSVTISAPVSTACVAINAMQGVAITPVTMIGSGGTGSGYTFSASGLPAGLTVSVGGTISGTPTVSGTFNYTVTVKDSAGNTGTVNCSVTISAPVSTACVAINAAIQGVAITPTGPMAGSGGAGGPYTFSATGLPAGLTMSSNGSISGTPTVSGTFNYTVTVKDSAGNTGTVNCSVTVATAVSATGAAITGAIQGVAITPTGPMTGSGGAGGPYTFSATGLPAGLTMSSNGSISGTPTVSGTFNYMVTVQDSAGNTGTVNCPVTIAAPVSSACVAITGAIQGVAITPVTMIGSGGTGSGYTFSVSGLPAGLTISAGGMISGTPTVSGTFNYTVTVKDSAGNTGTVNCSVTVAAPVSSACVAINAAQGVAITPVTMIGSGGTGSGYTFSATGLPAGLTIYAGSTVSGTPTVSGTFNYSVTVKDSAGNSGTVNCSVTVAAPVTTACVAINAIQGVAITPVTMIGSGGTGTGYTFSATGLPAGLTITAGGTISGTPTVSGTFNYTVTVKDSAGNSGTVNCSVTIAAPVSSACVAINAIQGAAITPVTMIGSGGTGSGYTFSATGLPAGLTISAGGTISGTPTVSGTFNYSVTVKDSAGNTGTVNCSVTIAAPVSSACVATNAIQGVAISPVTMIGSGGTGSGYTFSASGLPAGLTISAGGTISGTPTVSGTFNYTVAVKDSAGNTGTVNCSVTITAPVSSACVAINAIQGVAITPVTMVGSGGTGSGYTFSASGLPAGLTISAGGTISGTPTVSGTFNYSVTVKDSAGNTGTVSCSVTIAAPVSTACVAINAIQGVAITPVTMTGSGGTGSGYTFSASGLPAGVTISVGGTISGTPAVSGTFNYTVTVKDSAGNTGTVNCSVTIAAPVSATGTAITGAIQGVAITPTGPMTGSGGAGGPYTFSATGLPAGLTMSSNGSISGTPTVSGTFNYTVTVKDSAGNTGTVNCSVTIAAPVSSACVAINAAQGVAITPVTMIGSGGTGAGYTFSASGLPAGLTISAAGTISGTPTVSGTFNYTVTVKDSAGNTGTVNCSVTVAAPVSTACVAINAIQGVAITPVTMIGSGGTGSGYTVSASGLPAGLTISAGGTISGTPTVSGIFSYTVTVQDSAGNTGMVNCSVTIAAPVSSACVAINAAQGVAITPVTMIGSGGTGSGYTFSASGLPAGLTISAAGTISGTPTVSGTFNYSVTVKDSAGNTGTVNCSVTVAAPVSAACVAINAMQGVAITPVTMTGSGGTGTGYTFSASGLPSGLTMSAGGTISGTPTVSGTFNYSVTVKDSAGNTGTVNCSVTIAAPVSTACVAINAAQGVAITPVTMIGSGGTGSGYTFSASGLPAGVTISVGGTISGTPTVSGIFSYTVTVQDSAGNTGTVNCSVTVAAGPVISNIQASGITSSSATISWATDVSSDSQVDYGTTSAYGASSALNSTAVTAHNVALSGLAASTVYHYRVKSRNSQGLLTVSADNMFTTASGSVGATPVRVQSKGGVGNYARSVTLTFPNATATGNELIVAVTDYYPSEGVPFTISDSKGNTWKTAIDYVNSAHIIVFYAENIVGGAGETVTVTASGPTYYSVTGMEYAGLATSNSLDVTAVNRGTGASYTSGAAAIASPNELLLGVHHVWGGGTSFTPSAGWSTVGLQVSGDEAQVQDQVVAAPGSYASTGTESSSNDTVSVLVAFKPGVISLAPTISSFTATPAAIVIGQSSTLSWNTVGATSVTIDSGVGQVAVSGSTSVTPAATITYTLTATNAYGTTTAQSTITVGSGTPVRVQSKGAVGSYARVVPVTFTNPTATGNQLIVAVTDYYPSEGAPFTISDSKGNTWKTAIDYVNSAHIIVFYAENIVGGAGDTVTVMASGPTYFSVTAAEYAGLATSNSLDVTAVNRGTGASYTSGAATIGSANELLLGVHHVWGGGVSFTPAAGWSTVGLQVSGDEAQVQDRIVSAAGTYASTGTESSSNDTVSLLVAFKGR
jgi:Putative Ig domain